VQPGRNFFQNVGTFLGENDGVHSAETSINLYRLKGVISQKTVIFRVTAVRI